MCKYGEQELVKVRIPGDLDRTGRATWRHKRIDKCIAGIVRALQREKIHMRGSCCGHMEVEGCIHLQDGRVLLVLDEYDGRDYMRAYPGMRSVPG